MARLTAFQGRAQQAVVDLTAVQEQLTALMVVPEPTAVTATIDATGTLVDLAIDEHARLELTDEQLSDEIAIAVAMAARDRPTLDARDLRAQGADGLDVAEMLDGLFSGAVPPSPPEPMWNYDRTIAVTVVAGVVTDVRAQPRWLGKSIDAVAAREIVEAAAAAQRRSRGGSSSAPTEGV
ncbi:YbaB/EbfC family nucleoid-associated protein [Microbacterium testaceum]|uniref:YbaB/EbfC family nucleoid-associated protein n=1 Tax=Microbacterium testaceum TaxID=2033 RepID=UPI0027D81B7E|nr:YbaB/EbfC family nucleoid-associated protein [Microbacterium testaceum]